MSSAEFPQKTCRRGDGNLNSSLRVFIANTADSRFGNNKKGGLILL
jgi:hypothetical protein